MMHGRVQPPFCFAVGAFSVPWLPLLIPPLLVVVLLLAVLLFYWRRPRTPQSICVLMVMLGIGWGTVATYHTVNRLLPASLDKTDWQVRGTVVSLVEVDDRRQQFDFIIDRIIGGSAKELIPRKVRLSWYGAQTLAPGQQWELTLRLRQPRGFANVGLFNYERWLVANHFSATGYVREASSNRHLGDVTFSVHRVRQQLAMAITGLPIADASAAVLRALLLGDRRGLSTERWQFFARLGIVHLLVISGLHIGLVAGFGYLLGKVCNRALSFSPLRHYLHWTPSLCAIGCALFYALLAGLTLPTQRALLAVVVVGIWRLVGLRLSVWSLLGVVLAAIALLDPLAALTASFWLSFGAVIILIAGFSGAITTTPQDRVNHRVLSAVRLLLKTQWVLLVGLGPLLLLLFGQLSWLAPLVNLIAVPLVSLVLVPLGLLALVLLVLWPSLGASLFTLLSVALEWVLSGVEHLAGGLSFAYLPVAINTGWLVALGCLALWVVLPKGVPSRWLLLTPVLLLPFSIPQRDPLAVTLLDVGQGLAVTIETPDATLVYDTGARYGDFDSGGAVVAPYLLRRGRQQLDLLVVSHADNDHAGGVGGLLATLPVAEVVSGEPLAAAPFAKPCIAGQRWRYGELSLEVLWPTGKPFADGNNSSCVLLVRWRDQSILLSGDIEASVERRLLANAALPQNLTALVAPHHGSKTSSSVQFVDHLKPQQVLFSAGYHHHFGHPAAPVVARYKRVGSTIWNSGEQGAIVLRWGEDGRLEVTTARSAERYFWR